MLLTSDDVSYSAALYSVTTELAELSHSVLHIRTTKRQAPCREGLGGGGQLIVSGRTSHLNPDSESSLPNLEQCELAAGKCHFTARYLGLPYLLENFRAPACTADSILTL